MRAKSVFRVVMMVVLIGLIGALPETALAQRNKGKKGKAATFQMYKDKSGKYRFRMTNAKGRSLVIVNKGYKSKSDLMSIITAIQRNAARAPVAAPGKKTVGKGKAMLSFVIYQSTGKRKDFRFRIMSKGKNVARSSTGYKTLADARGIVDLVKQAAMRAKVMEKK